MDDIKPPEESWKIKTKPAGMPVVVHIITNSDTGRIEILDAVSWHGPPIYTAYQEVKP